MLGYGQPQPGGKQAAEGESGQSDSQDPSGQDGAAMQLYAATFEVEARPAR